MGRQQSIARSVTRAITGDKTIKTRRTAIGVILALFSTLFALYELPLRKVKPVVFRNLRSDHWSLNDDDYIASFEPDTNGEGSDASQIPLHAIGDMGFSGSTFYSTSDQKYLVKSIPRPSEYTFFKNDLLAPYASHMASNPTSLLVRICDLLAADSLPAFFSLGRALGLAPSHHIVMDNIMRGQADADEHWEDWDLKPTSYFYPERDIADGALTSEATKDQLPKKFKEKIMLSRQHADKLMEDLEKDTQFLAEHNAVDYSLFLVRIPVDDPQAAIEHARNEEGDETLVPSDPPAAPPAPPSWRAGMPSADGKHLYRAAVLDFFWAKHKVQPKLMTALITAWDAVFGHGHMSITTTPSEYRERFLKMCREYVEIIEDQ